MYLFLRIVWRITKVQLCNMSHFKAFGMRNLQYAIETCNKIHNKGTMIWWLIQVTIFLSGTDFRIIFLKVQVYWFFMDAKIYKQQEEIRQFLIWYARSLICWDKGIVKQVSNVPGIIFSYDFLQNSLQKYFQFIFVFFYKIIEIKSFECPTLCFLLNVPYFSVV